MSNGTKCGLTLRSSGHAPARHLGREALRSIIRLAAKLPHRRVPLSSNVRPHRRHSASNEASSQRRPVRAPSSARSSSDGSWSANERPRVRRYLRRISGNTRAVQRRQGKHKPSSGHPGRGPPVRWRAAHLRLFTSKELKPAFSPSSGALAKEAESGASSQRSSAWPALLFRCCSTKSMGKSAA